MSVGVAERARSLAQEVADSLEEAIISGRIRPRERLVELEVAARYGVSRAPVREALLILQRDGLVAKTGHGFAAADVTAAEAADIFEILAHLEALYTTRATPHIAPAGVRQMGKTLAAMASAVRRNDVAAYFRLNLEFHGVIRDACPNRPLIGLLDSLGKRTLRLRRLAMSIPGRMPESIEEHRRILAAIERGDAAAAGRHARDSAQKAYARLAGLLEHSDAIA